MTGPDLNNLSVYYTDQLIINHTIIQIRKDLELDDSELFIKDIETSYYESLIEQLSHIIEFLIDKSFERFMQVLYKVDINQKQLQVCILNGLYDSKCVAELIVKRCLQKVVIREWYKKNK